MNISFGRRIALIAGAVAVATSVLGTPAEPAAASSLSRTEPVETVAGLVSYPPDIRVTTDNIQPHVNGASSYMFRVKNIGKGQARYMTIAKEAITKTTANNTFVSQNLQTYKRTVPVDPGQSFLVEVPCPATSTTYCDYGRITITDVGPVYDADAGNNYAYNHVNLSLP